MRGLDNLYSLAGFTDNPGETGTPAWLAALNPAARWGIETDTGGRSYNAGPLSCVRASTGYARTLAGVWMPFAINTPRTTDRGTTVEPARTNEVINNTADSGTGLLLTGTTRTATAAGDSPANDNNGKLVTQGAGASDGMTFGVFANLITAGSRHALSIDLAYNGSLRYIRVLLSDNISIVHQCWIDLVDKVSSNPSAGTTVTVVPTTWGVRLELVTGTFANTTANSQMSIIAVTAMGGTTRAAGTYKVWGGQVEKDQTTVTTPILTSGAAATRAADAITVPKPNGIHDVSVRFANGTPDQVIADVAGATFAPLASALNARTITDIWGVAS